MSTESIPPAAPVKKAPPIPTPYNVNVPPGERVSIFNNTKKSSTEAEWKCCPPIGWVLMARDWNYLSDSYFASAISNLWFNNSERVTAQGEYYVAKSEVTPENGLYMDAVTGEAFKAKPEELPDDLRDMNGKKILAAPGVVARYFRPCVETGFRYYTDYMLKIHGTDPQLWLSKMYFKKHCLRGNGAVREGAKYIKCDNCGNIFFANQVHQRPDLDNAWMCDSCYGRNRWRNAVRSHDDRRFLPFLSKPSARLVKGKKVEYNNPRYFGVECELGFNENFPREQIAYELAQILGNDFCYMKHDGSITKTGNPKQGFEIVTAPAHLDIHRERWGKIEAYERYKMLRSWDTDTCGMHVHVSRAALNSLQIGRILVFINHKDNKQFVQQVAGRGELKWTRYYDKGLKDALHPDSLGDRDLNRRVAVNLQNRETIEFRIFRGTINPRHIIRNIEFCDAVCDFCWPASRSFSELKDYRYFVKFVTDNAKLYPGFYKWIVAESHARRRKPKPGEKHEELEELRPKKKQFGEGDPSQF